MSDWKSVDEPIEQLKRELCLTGLTYYIDLNVLDEASPAMDALRRSRREGWVRLQRTDTLDTEIGTAKDGLREQLWAESSTYVESLGSAVLGHSRLGHTRLTSPDDTGRLDAIISILKPGVLNRANLRRNDLRDAMHLATALKYVADGFITHDANMLKKTDQIAALTASPFAVIEPEVALTQIRDAVLGYVGRHDRHFGDAWCPSWRP